MKRILSISIIVLIFLTSCGKKDERLTSTATETLPANEKVFTWWEDRVTAFGNYEYEVPEKELDDVMSKKFKLKLLPSFKEAHELFKKEFILEDCFLNENKYELFASDNELKLTNIMSVKNSEGDFVSLAQITENYEYIASQKKVKIASQRIEFNNWTGDGKFHGKDFRSTIEELAKLLNLEDMDAHLADFYEKNQKVDQLKGKDLVIYENYEQARKKKMFGKSFGVEYSSDGIPEKIYLVTVDYRK